MATAIKFCSCSHKDQDERYGEHQRVHNSQPEKGKSRGSKDGWRCTVCGRT